jgi:hypothetical protein
VIFGTYESYNQNSVENVLDYFSNRKYLIGTSIKLNNDSTFIFKNCSQNMIGYWKIKNDTLLLFCKEKKFLIDSLNYSDKYKEGIICSKEPFKYKIKGTHLLTKNFQQNKYYYQDLEKIN